MGTLKSLLKTSVCPLAIRARRVDLAVGRAREEPPLREVELHGRHLGSMLGITGLLFGGE